MANQTNFSHPVNNSHYGELAHSETFPKNVRTEYNQVLEDYQKNVGATKNQMPDLLKQSMSSSKLNEL